MKSSNLFLLVLATTLTMGSAYARGPGNGGGMGGAEVIVDGHIVGFDEHPFGADGRGNFLLEGLQAAEHVVGAVGSRRQRHAAGDFLRGWLGGDRLGQAGHLPGRQGGQAA